MSKDEISRLKLEKKINSYMNHEQTDASLYTNEKIKNIHKFLQEVERQSEIDEESQTNTFFEESFENNYR